MDTWQLPIVAEGDTRVQASTNIPDSEDINNDNTMSETESYFEYVVDFEKFGGGNNDIGNLNPKFNQVNIRLFKIDLIKATHDTTPSSFRTYKFTSTSI